MVYTSSNKDGNVGPFPAPACPGYCGNFGGGKPPPPTVTQCNMLVTWRKMNGRHLATAQYARGAEQNMRQLA